MLSRDKLGQRCRHQTAGYKLAPRAPRRTVCKHVSRSRDRSGRPPSFPRSVPDTPPLHRCFLSSKSPTPNSGNNLTKCRAKLTQGEGSQVPVTLGRRQAWRTPLGEQVPSLSHRAVFRAAHAQRSMQSAWEILGVGAHPPVLGGQRGLSVAAPGSYPSGANTHDHHTGHSVYGLAQPPCPREAAHGSLLPGCL